MKIRKRASGFWWIEAFGWKLSVKVGWFRCGYRRIDRASFTWGLPFATGNVARMRASR